MNSRLQQTILGLPTHSESPTTPLIDFTKCGQIGPPICPDEWFVPGIGLARQTGKSLMVAEQMDKTLEYILGQTSSVTSQMEGIPQDNVVPIIFSMNIPQLIGQDALRRIHGCGLPETLLLDIYMSWRTITKRPPSTNADFTQFYSYFQDQLELVYDGMGLEFPRQNTLGQVYLNSDQMVAGELDFLVNTTYLIGSNAELHLGPTLAAMPDHEFVFDSVRDFPGVDGLSLTMVHDPRMTTPGDEDPIEMGPTRKLKFGDPNPTPPIITPQHLVYNLLAASQEDDKDRYGF